MLIAVVGAGISGVTIACRLAQDGHRVHLFDQRQGILCGSTRWGAVRLHGGYLYATAPDAASLFIKGLAEFNVTYPEQLISTECDSYYLIAEDSSLTPSQYLRFLEKMDLPWQLCSPSFIKLSPSRLCVKVREIVIDHEKLVTLCLTHLKQARVSVMLGNSVSERELQCYDYRIFATYGQVPVFVNSKEKFNFEVIEHPVVSLPECFSGTSVMVIQGDYCGFGPFGRSDYHILGGGSASVLQNVGDDTGNIQERFSNLLNTGLTVHPLHTAFSEMSRRMKKHFDLTQTDIDHIGSIYSLRSRCLGSQSYEPQYLSVTCHDDDRNIMTYCGKVTLSTMLARRVSRLIQSH